MTNNENIQIWKTTPASESSSAFNVWKKEYITPIYAYKCLVEAKPPSVKIKQYNHIYCLASRSLQMSSFLSWNTAYP